MHEPGMKQKGVGVQPPANQAAHEIDEVPAVDLHRSGRVQQHHELYRPLRAVLTPQLDRLAAARQVAPDGPSDIDHLAAPGRCTPATEAITDGAGEALGDPLGLRRLLRADESAQIGPGGVTPACDQPTGAAPFRAASVSLRM